jgi:hypothetical protein
MSRAIWIHRKCKPVPGREEIAAARDKLISATPHGDGGLHWLFVTGDTVLGMKCGICRETFKEGDAATGFSPD